MAMLGMSSCERSGWSLDESKPVTMLRFRSTNTESDEEWAKTFAIIKENPGCCDEVWFSTGVVIPPLEWHQEQADRMAKAKEQLKGSFVLGLESTASRMSRNGKVLLLNGKVLTEDEVLKEIGAVTREDFDRNIALMLDRSQMSAAVVGKCGENDRLMKMLRKK